MRIGITGGIGCGKSAFGRILATRGWRLIQTDLTARDILNTPEVAARVRARFGPDVIGPDGLPDRAALARVVFADRAALADLEAELHPRVQTAWRAEIEARPDAAWAVEIPLLFEKNLEGLFDFTVCVHCSPTTQLARLAARGLPEDQATARIRAQSPLETKLSRADIAVFNDGSPGFLAAQAASLDALAPHLLRPPATSRATSP